MLERGYHVAASMLRSAAVVWMRAGLELSLVGCSLTLASLSLAEPLPAAAQAAGASLAADTAPQPQLASQRAWRPKVHARMPAHHLRSFLEMGVGLAAGSVAYWLMQDRNIADWDNPTPEERFNGRAWRFDNNSLAVNFIAHPFMGGLAQSLARANHHDVYTAFAYSSLTSFLWEFVLEFKEKVSVNDLIVTSPTGIPIGEFFHKLGLYLDSAHNPGLGLQTARWLLGTGAALDRALDGRAAPHVPRRDALGFTSQIWHQFAARYGFDFVDSLGAELYSRQRLGLTARLATLPGYLGPKSVSRGFYQAEISEFSVANELSDSGVGLLLSADTLLAGYHLQSMQGGSQAPHGVAATFGTSIAYYYLRSTANRYAEFAEAEAEQAPDISYHAPTRAEQFSALHLPGAAVDWHVLLPLLSVRVAARAYPSFAGFGAPAFYDWAADHLEEKAKHILHRQGYFYGWGGAGSLSGDLRIGHLLLGGHASYAQYASQDGMDRHIERVTADVPARGNWLVYGGSVGVRPPGMPFSLGAEFGVRRWYSDVAGYERRGRSVSRGLMAQVEF